MPASAPNVVVGYEGSPGAKHALTWAAHEAARSDSELHVVAAVPMAVLSRHREQLREPVGSILDVAEVLLRKEYPKLTVRTITAETPAPEALLDHATGGDLLVVGRRGHGAIADALLGSVSLHVAAHARCPVVVVPPEVSTPQSGDVVAGVGDPTDTPVLDFALARARTTGAGVIAVHAWSLPVSGFAPELAMPLLADTREMFAAHDTVLDQVVEAATRDRSSATEIDSRAVEGHAGHALTEAAADAALLVVGAHRRRGAFPLRISPTAHYVLHHAPCPVAVVPVAGRGHPAG